MLIKNYLLLVLTFHGVLPNGQNFVARFILMQTKSEANYREVLIQMKNIINSMNISLNQL